MSLKSMMLQRLEEVQGAPKKSLGQNFLINQHVVDKIIQKAASTQAQAYIEVGPGLGALTEQLIPLNKNLQLLEMDSQFAAYWRGRDQKVHEGDALQMNWQDLVNSPTCFVSNLPYQISARIVIDRSASPEDIQWMILMFQKEVAERVVSSPKSKDYGFLSVVAQLAWKVEKLVDASPQDFYPPPKVSSRVLYFHRKATLPEAFIGFVKKAFENRRKFMLKNFTENKEKLISELQALGYTEKVRAEEISPDHFQRLYQAWSGS